MANTDHGSSPGHDVLPGPLIPLRTLQRSRGSLQWLEDQSPSMAATLGERIQEDIDNGNYDCSICYSNVRRASIVWSCYKCWYVFHYNCIEEWAASRGIFARRGSRRWLDTTWSCPNCRALYAGPPLTSCWCGRDTHPKPDDQRHGVLPHNSCGAKCGHTTPCGQLCERICHAGPCPPCEVRDLCPGNPCSTSQPGSPASVPQVSLPAATQQAQPNQQRPAVASDYEPRIPASRVSPAIVIRSSLELYPRSSHNQHHRDRHTHQRHRENRSTRGGGPQENPQVQSAPQYSMVTRVLIFLLGNALVGALTYYLCLVVVEPYHHPSVAESHAMMTVLYIIVISVALAQCYGNMFFWKVVKDIALWCRGASDIGNWGRYRRSRFPALKQKCSTVVLHFMLCFGVCFFSILVLGPFAGTILAPMVGREHEFKSVCDGFDTRIELDFDAAWPYHSILFRNHFEPDDARPLSMRYSTEFAPLLRNNITTLVVNQEEMTQSEKLAHGISYNTPAFLAFDFDYDTIVYDFVNGHWSTTLNGTLQRNGSFVHSNKDLILPELGLQIPDFADFERNCIYEPFVKVHRGSGDATELDRQRSEKFTYNNRYIVLRTASFGWSQGALVICAQKESTVSENGVILRKGLGDDLPVVAGLIATLRYDGFMRKTRKLCGSWGIQKVSDSGYQWSLPA